MGLKGMKRKKKRERENARSFKVTPPQRNRNLTPPGKFFSLTNLFETSLIFIVTGRSERVRERPSMLVK